jgi:hypothetical protein
MIEFLVLIFLLFWIFSGLAAFIMSLVCFGYGGTAIDKVVGLILAIFFGPFYWFFYGFNTYYCNKNS